MKIPIFLKIFSGYLLVSLALSGLFLAITFQTIRSHYLESSTNNLRSLSIAVQEITSPLIQKKDISGLDSLIRNLGQKLKTRITIINAQGVVLADSETDSESLENHRNRPEVLAALSGNMGRTIRYSTTLNKEMLYVALPMELSGRITAVMRLSLPFEDIDRLLRTLRWNILQMASMIIVFSIIIALLFSHIISLPIRELNRASRQVASGNLNTRVSLTNNDEIRELAESFNDMTEKLQTSFTELSRSKEELESIISSISEALLVIDKEGRIILFNKSAERIARSDRIAGKYYWEVIRSERFNSLVELEDNAPASNDFELNERSYLCSVTPIRSAEAKVILLHDITQMRQIETIKKDLVVNVSHELRTPLTAIKGFTETLIDEESPQNREYLEIIQRHTDRLIKIVNDLLDLSELEENVTKLNREAVDLHDIMDKVLVIFSQKVKDKGLELKVEGPKPVIIQADPFRLEQMFSNLVDNAIKYTEKGAITISIEDSSPDIIIRISDTGIGIAREHIPRIFERFYVVDKSRSRSVGGTGLGLAIVKHIVSLHQGTISVQSTPPGGTTFIIRLPRTGRTTADIV